MKVCVSILEISEEVQKTKPENGYNMIMNCDPNFEKTCWFSCSWDYYGVVFAIDIIT